MIMAGNPNWWSMHPPTLIPPHAGLPGEKERMGSNLFQNKKMEIWEDHQNILNNNNPSSREAPPPVIDVIKQEVSQQSGNLYSHGTEEFHHQQASGSHGSSSYWLNNMVPQFIPSNSSPKSRAITSSSNDTNILDFTYNKPLHNNNQLHRHSPSESNNSSSIPSGVCNKKAKVQASPSLPPLKVRKEKLGDRITALHQLVSPFGKTDTASVLLEAIGYIRFLQGQIEALSLPYMSNASKSIRNQRSVHGERNSVFPEDPGQLLNDNGLKRKGASKEEGEEKGKNLRSRGLCLVPVSCTQHVGSENGADYWAPAYGSGF
ncbi:transcription factor bHLH68-like isoform X2 [Prosopis cineraria]|uniref:transcription factor bHLH68-like isoform X2 n=1 Tax=Prosopis cineraria TaxID=364024 RepID=UPI00240F463C|nr:transcription factor bHLH68-like isoform X2 [Prosopis cineraria]